MSIVWFYEFIFFVYKCVLYYCHRVATQLQLNISYNIVSYHIISYRIVSYHIISDHIMSYHIICMHTATIMERRLQNCLKSHLFYGQEQYTVNILFTYSAPTKNCEKRLLTSLCFSVRPSVRPYGTTQIPLDRFSGDFVFDLFFENLARKFKFN
jgi:hypothetical protein